MSLSLHGLGFWFVLTSHHSSCSQVLQHKCTNTEGPGMENQQKPGLMMLFEDEVFTLSLPPS